MEKEEGWRRYGAWLLRQHTCQEEKAIYIFLGQHEPSNGNGNLEWWKGGLTGEYPDQINC